MKFAYSLLLFCSAVLGPGTYCFGQADRNLVRDKPAANPAKRTALVIGNGAYADAPLKNPPNDATDVAAALKQMGFEVMAYTDLDQTGMKRAIREFGSKLRANGGVGLFYYAGHGVQVKGTNYLIPIGATVNNEEEIEYESVEAGLAIAQMEAARNPLNIIILDACRNNPFARSMRSADKGLASIDAPSGTLIAYSTAPGSVASDGAGRNGLYTQELLKRMTMPGKSIEEVFKHVRIAVRTQTAEKQTPWEVSSLTGDFYFAAGPATAQAETSIAKESAETTFWRSIENSTEAKDFENYLARSSSGEFAGTYKAAAELKLSSMAKTPATAAWTKVRGLAAAFRRYEQVGIFREGLATFVTAEGKFGYLDESGREVIPPIFSMATEFRDGIAMVMVGTMASGTAKFKHIDKSGRDIFPANYTAGSQFSDGVAAASLDGKYGYIDRTGREVIPFKYILGFEFSEGFAAVMSKEGKMGYIDKSGSIVIPFKYSVGMPFGEGLAAVGIANNGVTKYAFIDKSGREVIAPKYDLAYKFDDGVAAVGYDVNGKLSWGLIDRNGIEVIPTKYDEASPYAGVVFAKSGGRYGLLDKAGKEIVPFKYDKGWCWTFAKDGLFGVILNGKKAFVDLQGNEFFDF